MPLSQIQFRPVHEQEHRDHPRHGVSWYLVLLALAAIVIGLVVLLIPHAARYRALGEMPDADFRRRIGRFKAAHFNVPNRPIREVSPELIVDVMALRAANESIPAFDLPSRFDIATSMSEAGWSPAAIAELERMVITGRDALTTAGIKLGQDSDFRISDPSFPAVDSVVVAVDNAVLNLSSISLLREQAGDWDGATSAAATALRLCSLDSDHPVYDYWLSYMPRIALLRAVQLGQSSPNVSAARTLLEILNAAGRPAAPATDEEGAFLYALWKLETMRGMGYPVQYASNASVGDLLTQKADVEDDLGNYLLQHKPADDPMRPLYAELADSSRHLRTRPLRRLSYVQKFRTSALRPFLGAAYTDLSIARQTIAIAAVKRMKSHQVQYDLAALELAVRVYRDSNGRSPSAQAELFPSHVIKVLADPYSGVSYKWSTTHQCFYSVGPDGRDDMMARAYTPWNSRITVSGDIAYPRPYRRTSY